MRILENNSERGQAIVYLVLGLVVFFGFVALAIDGGMVLADRRHVQNAADASSLAGGSDAGLDLKIHQGDACSTPWTCNSPYIIAAEAIAKEQAIKRADENGFTIFDNLATHNGVIATCAGGGNPYIDVTVEISSTTPSNFLQIISPQALQNDVQSVTRVYPGGPAGNAFALVSLNPNDCGSESGAVFKGTGDLGITGGGVFSNGCLEGAGQPTVTITPTGSTPPYGYGGEFIPGNADWTPTPPSSPTGYQLPSYSFEIPFDTSKCTDKWDLTIPNNAPNLEGLYCYHGDLTINNNQVIAGTNVTFYVMGDVKFNGGATISLSSPPADSTLDDGTVPGVLIYVPQISGHTCADQTVDLEGNNETHIEGMIYAPCSKITLTGTEDSYMVQSQVIGWDVKVAGNANTTIEYDRCKGYIVSPYIELYK